MTAGSVCVPQIIPLRVPLPGKNKHEINTNTLVEMKSDTVNVNIYYTLDGSKPELSKRKGYGENNTLKYTGPITLPDGKIQVKAMAVSRDCRESGIVTKIFQVDHEPTSVTSQEDNDENFLKDLEKQELKNGNFASKLEEKYLNVENKLGCNTGIKHSQESTMESPSGQEEPIFIEFNQPQFTNTPCMNGQKNPNNPHVLRINKATNFFKCRNCLTTRPSDPFTVFCQECGVPIPPIFGQHLPPPEGAQMGLCPECRTVVPMTTPVCVVCETPLAPQLQPQTNFHLKAKVICQYCGTGNPAPFKHCVTCENRLPETHVPMCSGEVASPVINQKAATISCSKCGRRNRCDARFCDWCGAKSIVPASYFICTRCRASNYPSARYCGFCGDYVEPFPRTESSDDVIFNPGEVETYSGPRTAWLQASMRKFNMPTKDKSTQTIGLFYPSSKFLGKKEMELVSQRERQEKMNDCRPPLTAISPGRGYWRKQLDHISAHLRSYTQNNPVFRALVGEPRMGKLLSATIHEDGYAVSIKLNYMQVTENIFTNKVINYDSHFPRPRTESRNGHYSGQVSPVNENDQSTLDSSRDITNKRKIKLFQEKEDQFSPENKELLNELCLKGEGRIFVIEQMLEEGADPNCTNNEDRPPLTLAVLNKHHEAIPVLLQKGADIDHQSGPLRNTALHEACLLGPEGIKCIAALLRYNASIQKKNKEGHSAYDLALKTGNDQIISLFAAKLDKGTRDQHTQPKNLSLLDF